MSVTHASPAANAVSRKAPALTASLLEVVASFDGDKEAQFNVAHQALYSAYALAFTHGNKTQLTEVVNSTGKKRHVTAMRNAVIAVGIPSLHKTVANRQDAIDTAVAQVMDLYAVKAFPQRAATPTQAKGPTPTQQLKAMTQKAESLERKLAVATALRASAEDLKPATVIAYAASLPDAELAALSDALLKQIEARMHPASIAA